MPPDNMITFKVLIKQRHWTYITFCHEYDKAAYSVDPKLMGRAPSRAQFHRWLSGSTSRPHPDHCRVLESLFDEWTIDQLFAPQEQKITQAETAISPHNASEHGLGGVTSVFPTRSQFLAAISPLKLFNCASSIRTCGISLNMICQQYPTNLLRTMIESGASVRCLFLDPDGHYISEREREEGFDRRQLKSLTQMNVDLLLALRDRLSDNVPGLHVGLYDEPARYNLTIIDDAQCVLQPYLPGIRGIESPTILAARDLEDGSIFETFNSALASLEDRCAYL